MFLKFTSLAASSILINIGKNVSLFRVLSGTRYCTCNGLSILFSHEAYNLYSIASQLKRVIDPVTSGILRPVRKLEIIFASMPFYRSCIRMWHWIIGLIVDKTVIKTTFVYFFKFLNQLCFKV